jgi:hypothetical protein
MADPLDELFDASWRELGDQWTRAGSPTLTCPWRSSSATDGVMIITLPHVFYR